MHSLLIKRVSDTNLFSNTKLLVSPVLKNYGLPTKLSTDNNSVDQ